MNETDLRRQLAETTKLLAVITKIAPARLEALHDARVGHPAGYGFDKQPGRATIIWCDTHEQEIHQCHRDDHLCDGVPIVTAGDPTGEAAMTTDRAQEDWKELRRLVRVIARHAELITIVLDRYTRRAPTESERLATLKANERAGGCWSCARIRDNRGTPAWSPVFRATTVNGEKRDLCEWCYRRHNTDGELPTVRQLQDRHAGKRVRRSA